MKHNNEGQHDLDHIIMAMLRGMERALLEYSKLSAGLIFCIDRSFSIEKNKIIIEKAIKYRRRGVVGIDVAGPGNSEFKLADYKDIFAYARTSGLHITTHSGETGDANDMWEALEFIKPERIGHGIKAAYDKKLMQELVKQNVVLEVCPMSNIATKAVENVEELEFILKTFVEHNVMFSINTDWPEMIQDAHLWRQFKFLEEHSILTIDQLKKCNEIGFQSTFIPKGGLEAYL
jgi:adenosine deaminase